MKAATDGTALILGGGVGGLVAANELRRALPRKHRVVVVEREESFVFAPSLLWLLTGDRELPAISRPLARLARKGIEVFRGEVEAIDPARREVSANGIRLTGDYLVIALGAEPAPELVPGLAEAGHNLYTPSGASDAHAALDRFDGGRLVLLTATAAYKCPAAPYEAAMLVESYCRRRRIRERTEIALYAAEAGPMGVAGPEVSKAVRQIVEAKGIVYHPEQQVTRVDAKVRKLVFANGTETSYDLLLYVPPHRAPRPVHDAGLTNGGGWVPVDRHTMETRFPRVYALGDVVSIPLKLGKPLPKAGVFAQGEARIVARNIARDVTGRGRPEAFDGHGACFIETGGGRAGFGSGNFYAEPAPQVRMRAPSRFWHVGKILFERDWLRRWL